MTGIINQSVKDVHLLWMMSARVEGGGLRKSRHMLT